MTAARELMPPLAVTDPAAARARAAVLAESLSQKLNVAHVNEARDLLLTLRNVRAYEPMARLAEVLSRIDLAEATTRRLYAQCLIELGYATVAIDVLRQLIATLPVKHTEAAEAWGLLGRAHKQIFFDAADGTSLAARQSLRAAVDAYFKPYKLDPARHTWHGVNVLALVSRARREGWNEIAPTVDIVKLGDRLMKALVAIPLCRRDEWTLPTMAEVALSISLSRGDVSVVERMLSEYLQSKNLQAFQVASTLRQFTEVWGLETLQMDAPGTAITQEADVRRARGLVDILRARLLQLPGGEVRVTPTHATRSTSVPDADTHLEAILGEDGPETYRWWRAGVDAARSVGAVRKRLGKRIGTGFLVSARQLGLMTEGDELLLLTNHHVVNPEGVGRGIRPEQAEVVFEVDDPGRPYEVDRLLWTSPVDQHDASLLRLKALPTGVPALTVSPDLPELPPPGQTKRPRVYVIGYPGGRELSFSFQDNELIDHEGPPAGRPGIPGVCRVHYRAPTQGGSSGSPVFESSGWRVIALHHSGGRLGMPRLNGCSGTYPANEGLAMGPLLQAVAAGCQLP